VKAEGRPEGRPTDVSPSRQDAPSVHRAADEYEVERAHRVAGDRGVLAMPELLARPDRPDPTLLEPALVTKGGITLIAAPTKIGKTNLELHLAWALTEGRPLFGRFGVRRPVSVLMIQLELSEEVLKARLSALVEILGWTPQAQARFHVYCRRAILLDRRTGPDELTELIELAGSPEVVVLDSYNAAVAGDPDKTAEARRALHALRQVQDRTGCTWILTAEMRKAPAGGSIRYGIDDLKGSNEIAYDSDALVALRPAVTDRRRLHIQFLAMRHAREDPPENLTLVRRGLTFELEADSSEAGEAATAALEVLRPHFGNGHAPTMREAQRIVRDGGVRLQFAAIQEIVRALRNGGTHLPPEEPS
jgi:KaiC/GvpD/RAD55 family RecA-like ATPase